MSSNNHKLLNFKGYKILKNKITPEQLKKVFSDLTVTPKQNEIYAKEGQVNKQKKFINYANSVYLPRYYGIEHFGQPNKISLSNNKVDIIFKGSLREKQQIIVDKSLSHIMDTGSGIISVGCGAGKCLAFGTLVMMFDGSKKRVENIVVGDVIMGDDGTKRRVLSTTKGVEEMFDVMMDYGKYTVNRSHILSLKRCDGDGNEDNVIDISVNDYLKNGLNMRGFRVGVDYGNKDPTPITPNAFGMSIMKCDHIPPIYKYNTTARRRSLILGIINNHGYKFDKKKFKSKQLFDDIIDLIRSIGMKFEVVDGVYVLSSSLDLTYDIELVSRGVGDYYGFEIDGNRRFLLGDFTVTHNTVMSLNMACQIGLKTLVVVHKTFLQNQWCDRIKQFTNAKIGIIRQNKVDVENKDIVIGMLQSISMKDYDPAIFKQFGLVIYDECHHVGSEIFSKALVKLGARYNIGLSATPLRADGLTKVINWYIGPIIYKADKKPNKNVIVKTFDYTSTSKFHKEKKQWIKGKMRPAVQKMITNFYKNDHRNQFIVNIINALRKQQERKILVLSGRLAHLDAMKNMVDKIIVAEEGCELLEPGEVTTGYYIGKMKEYQLRDASETDIIFATYAMAAEGLDIDKLNTLILATPKCNIIQSVGRIMRKPIKEGDIKPMIIDIIDSISTFPFWYSKRKAYYKKSKYNISLYQAHNSTCISIKDYLIKNNVISTGDIRKDYITYRYGADHYEFLEEDDFCDNEEDYFYDADLNVLLYEPEME